MYYTFIPSLFLAHLHSWLEEGEGEGEGEEFQFPLSLLRHQAALYPLSMCAYSERGVCVNYCFTHACTMDMYDIVYTTVILHMHVQCTCMTLYYCHFAFATYKCMTILWSVVHVHVHVCPYLLMGHTADFALGRNRASWPISSY